MHHRIYNLLKHLNRLIFPGAGAAYYGLSKIYHLPNENQVLGIIIILAALSGILLQLISKRFEPKTIFQGELVITETNEGKKMFSLELSKNPDEISHMEAITFKVVDIAK